MTNHHEAEHFDKPEPTTSRGADPRTDPLTEQNPLTLRTAGELADALPYLLGYRPGDSIVLAAVHEGDGLGNFGGRARLAIPQRPEDWPLVARETARSLIGGIERRRGKPDGMIVYLSQEPKGEETGQQVMERLRPLAQLLRTSCGSLDVPVVEALCLSGGRIWSYCCPGHGCCPPEGVPLGVPGTSVLAAAATYAGIQVRGSLDELRSRLSPWAPTGLEQITRIQEQERALDAARPDIAPRILAAETRGAVAEETADLARRVLARLAEAPPVGRSVSPDPQDDELLAHDEAAALLLGLQDRSTRDRVAEWMEGEEAAPALRLWRALARRCVGPYADYAAAPLTLAGWVAWSLGDEFEAREALAMALGADPQYTFARLLHRACTEGLDPEAVRRCLRQERADRESEEETAGDSEPSQTGDRTGEPREPGQPEAPGDPEAGTAAAPANTPAAQGGSQPRPARATRRGKKRPGSGPTGGSSHPAPRVPPQTRRAGRRGARSGR
ncbi:DUF4192 domain-containing protein [Streptomyces sp. SCSIO ZS0520]|uniref:DUF4192 domain-containing protein n=1 Tax=Streptomyces sp. SCSIO ZS0520 TaxID=2892996 RepID=UPI0021D9870A|nr:DUF4192 domain-containing protein [Streptomyces sp. SCSIO ZS0520]